MKRYFLIIMMMAAAVITSCTKQGLDENQPQVDSGSPTYTYTVSANVTETKTDYDSDGNFKWSAGDAISVLFNNGTDNKFFTLTLKSGDGTNTASFSGEIENGYEIGGTDGNQWALYPAGTHSVRFAEEDAAKYPLSFNIPAITDYTKSGFSANIPMYSIGEDGTSFNFQHLGAAYKFTFSDIEADKVKFVVENQTTYRLSGDVKLRNEKGTYLDQSYAEGVDKTLTYISSVSDGKATFFVPVRYYAECFQPIITLYNAENEAIIYTKTATKATAISSKGHVQPINISVSGAVEEAWAFPSQYDIVWNDIATSASGDTDEGYDGIVTMKATADATNLYLYLEVKKSALYDNNEYGHANQCNIYFGDGSGENTHWAWAAPYTKKMSGWMKYKNASRFIHYDGITYEQKTAEHLDRYCYELAVKRSDISALAGSSATICMEINQLYTDAGGNWLGSNTQIGFAPARWTEALTVTLPSE